MWIPVPERAGPITNHLEEKQGSQHALSTRSHWVCFRGWATAQRRSTRPRQTPAGPSPVGRPAFLPGELEQVVSEEQGHLVVVKELASLGVVTVAAVEDVERAVVTRALQVLHVIFHLHLHRVALVVLAALELLVAVLPFETLQGPFLTGRPGVLGEGGVKS